MAQLFQSRRLSNTCYPSILPIDQGIEHGTGAAFAPNPIYFDPENTIKPALRGGMKWTVNNIWWFGIDEQEYAHRIAFTIKINHNELLTFPQQVGSDLFWLPGFPD